jgi:hypothetical protein
MPVRKPKPKRRSRGYSGGFCSTPAQRAAQARIEQEGDRSNRALSDMFQFWRVCAKARCRRMQACAGVADCFSNKWRLVHPDKRFLVREASLARAHGADPKRATEIAQQKLAERNAIFARYDAVAARPDAQIVERAPPAPLPRVRRL